MMSTLYYCVIFILISITYSRCEFNEKQNYKRLPKIILPKFYDLKLWLPDIRNNVNYRGEVMIDVYVNAECNSIILNVDGLTIEQNRTNLMTNDNNSYNQSSVPILTQSLDTDNQFYVIKLSEDLELGNYTLYLFFSGEIRDDLFGFYKSNSKIGNVTRWLAVTQFSPIYARRAFPCFDEPYLKANFKLAIGHYDHLKVTSNTPAEKITQTDVPNYIITSMKITPKMSTYLFGWAVHDFEYFHLPNSTKFGIWSRETMKNNIWVTLESGWPLYKALESWLNVSSPLEKMEQIAVTDFHFRGMENWGMIAFRESVVLHDKKTTPTKTIHDGLSVIGHEYSHTWFGNLITPEFWNVGWLKEGFSTYFSYFGRSLLDPESRMMDLFVVENTHDVLLSDAANHNRTMNGRNSFEVHNIMEYLDFTSYSKGAAIVRMIQCIMGEIPFKSALQSYLRSRAYNFITPEIFYDRIRNYSTVQHLGSRIDIGEIIETYANQIGYPIVTVIRNYSENSIQLSQERFYLHSNRINVQKHQHWWIPLSLVSNSQRNSNISMFGAIWLTPDEKEGIIMKVNIDPMEWIICDIDKAGYYRVNYDEGNWNMLISHLGSSGFNTIRPIGRATLVDDTFNLARGGYIHYSITFRLVNYLTQETEYEPWYAAVRSFNFLKQIFQDLPAIQDSLQTYVVNILKNIYDTFSFDNINKDHQLRQKLLRNLILSTACNFNNHHCLKTARSIFQTWINSSSISIERDLKSFVYCAGIQSGNAEDWEKVFSRFIEADLHNEKELLINALGCSDNEQLINRLLYFGIFNSTHLPAQYRIFVIDKIVNGNPKNVNYTLEFMSKYVKKIVDEREVSFFEKIFNTIKIAITSTENLKKLSNFLEINKNYFAKSKGGKHAIDYAEQSIYWRDKYAPIIAGLLN